MSAVKNSAKPSKNIFLNKKASFKVISPISVDLGAKNTGVYFAHYPAGSVLGKDQIEKEGRIYNLEKDKYTLIMAQRTAKRHQRRGFKRRQMVKRLFKLIWCEELKLPWDKDTQQTISFLLNRRGFNFLTSEYNETLLEEFPKEALDLKECLKELKKHIEEELKDENYNFNLILQKLSEDKEELEGIYKPILNEDKKVRKELFILSTIKYLKTYCEKKKIDKKHENKLKKLTKLTFKKLEEKGIKGLQWNSKEKTMNVIDYLDKHPSKTEDIINSMPQNIEEEIKKLKIYKIENFDLEKKLQAGAFDSHGEKKSNTYLKSHLQHLLFALSKIYNELQSGSRHRSKYFDEIRKVLECGRHTHKYLKNFCNKLISGKYEPLDVDKLCNLIGHLSNFELKPLRKYFNNKEYREIDKWNEKKLKDTFNNWILKEWRVNFEKDIKKKEGAEQDYKDLKDKWKKSKKNNKTIVQFFLETDPKYTIPPYQDNNNRRPPKCQSLILNSSFLDKNYKQWESWLKSLKGGCFDYLGDYEKELANLKSRKGNKYFEDSSSYNQSSNKKTSQKRYGKDLKVRLLQFIFDRAKAKDEFCLNEIYSHTKKIKQKRRDKEAINKEKDQLEKTLEKSKLPKELKCDPCFDSDNIFPQSHFLHLVCKYYKLRQRAKEGRLFIHPKYHYVKGRGYENTGRFDDKNHLLTYCNHHPRQKRYQMFYDFASLLQISTKSLEKIIGSKKEPDLIKWLEEKDFTGLKSNCEKAAKEQKERKNQLRLDIDKIYWKIKSIKKIKALKKKNNEQDLVKLTENAKRLNKELFNKLNNNKTDQEDLEKSLERNPARAVYFLAQLNNLVFKERQGNSKTCAVCSLDNAKRMELMEDKVKASRLPAISTRLIDGAVMRLARIVGSAIAKDKWEKIKPELENDKKVCVPIVTESNHFEFEPDLRNLKNKKPKTIEDKSEEDFKSKEDRIKSASHNICPYRGNSIGIDGEIDHIIPRSSEYGTLNDEANLIWVSLKGNKDKGNKHYSLSHLRPEYKTKIFNGKSDTEIKKWIKDKIWDEEKENFKFGQYMNFTNLEPDEQKAFRHALFLIGDPLREKVINAIDSRKKALVNGTQRYFAEMIANNLYKEAKKINRQNQVSFDFFGVEAQTNSRGDGVYDLRKRYEEQDKDFFEKYTKTTKKDSAVKKTAKKPETSSSKNEEKVIDHLKQNPYSHLIDAQLAFILGLKDHQKEGSFKLDLNGHSIDLIDEDKNKIPNIFDKICVKPDEFKSHDLERRKAYDIETHHRKLLKNNENHIKISYKIHRDNFISEKFFHILKKGKEFKCGFDWNNSKKLKIKADVFDSLEKTYLKPFINKKADFQIWTIKKQKVQDFLMKVGKEGGTSQEVELAKIFDELSYYTKRKNLGRTVEEAKEAVKKMLSKNSNFKKEKVELPIFKEWKKLEEELEKEEDLEKPLIEFVKNSKIFKNKHKNNNFHNKVRKNYSLPIRATIANIRVKRKSWDKKNIIQISAEESIAQYGFKGDKRPHTILSKNSIPTKHYAGIPKEINIEERFWCEIPKEKISDQRIEETQFIHKDKGRCDLKLKLKSFKNLCIPDKQSWTGKIIVCENEKTKSELEQKSNDFILCIPSKFIKKKGETGSLSGREDQWFEDDLFKLPIEKKDSKKESREIKIDRDKKTIQFTISKNKDIQKIYNDYIKKINNKKQKPA